MTDQDEIADVRRLALKRAMEDHGMTPTDLARRCGFPTANAIYNFLNGISKSLSTTTYQAIVKQMPGVTINDLLGERQKKRESLPVLVKTYCQGGVLREQFSVPPEQMKELPLPVDDSARQAGAFAAIVRRPGAEEIYPEKTILLCQPIVRYEGHLTKGRRLIVERFVDTRIEVTVREIQEDAEGRLWLSQRSTDPRLSASVKLPQTISGKVWQSNGEKFAVAGVVIGAFIPESS